MKHYVCPVHGYLGKVLDRSNGVYPARWHRERQAEVSFRAGVEEGRREVVEWIESKAFITPYNTCVNCLTGEFLTKIDILVQQREWQAKLKEWGI